MELIRQRIDRMLPSLISIYIIFLISGTYIFSDCRFGVENHLSYYLPYILANFAVAFLLAFIISCFDKKNEKRISYVIITILSFLTILEGLIVYRYDVFFNAFVLDAVIHTNPVEANAVLKDNIFNVIILIILFIVLTVLSIIVYKKTSTIMNRNKNFKIISHFIVKVLLITTICVPPAYYLLRNVQKFSFYFFGISNQIERVFVAFYNSYENHKSYQVYIDDNLNFLRLKSNVYCPNDSLDCIVVIGESYAKSHSSLYSYKYNTCPLEKRLVDSGNLFVFKDAISCDNGTQSVFMKLFNFYGTKSKLLLPTVFKKCGFNCVNYDNCTLYNDYIINSIINKFKNRNAIVFYLPDHGEELYDYRNFKGHGNTINDRRGLIQVEIPFAVWISSKFKNNHPEVVKKLSGSVNNRFISTKLSNTILDAVGIKCKYSNPDFSIINAKFDNKKHRITAYGYDYDAY
jgi:glucan phosphoethanolaminetransferase (alkaline phosphatase superfamily)